jgi:hypothetical protein
MNEFFCELHSYESYFVNTRSVSRIDGKTFLTGFLREDLVGTHFGVLIYLWASLLECLFLCGTTISLQAPLYNKCTLPTSSCKMPQQDASTGVCKMKV